LTESYLVIITYLQEGLVVAGMLLLS